MLKLEMTNGDIICDRCDGVGEDPDRNSKSYWWKCSKCKGTGKLTWLENIFGKQERTFPGVHITEIDLS